LVSSVAVWEERAVVMLAAVENVPLVGSYNSALAKTTLLLAEPPAMRTFPLFSNVAVWKERGVVMEPVAVNVAVIGSYNSALER
jgi:hypothetical protein